MHVVNEMNEKTFVLMGTHSMHRIVLAPDLRLFATGDAQSVRASVQEPPARDEVVISRFEINWPPDPEVRDCNRPEPAIYDSSLSSRRGYPASATSGVHARRQLDVGPQHSLRALCPKPQHTLIESAHPAGDRRHPVLACYAPAEGLPEAAAASQIFLDRESVSVNVSTTFFS